MFGKLTVTQLKESIYFVVIYKSAEEELKQTIIFILWKD